MYVCMYVCVCVYITIVIFSTKKGSPTRGDIFVILSAWETRRGFFQG